MPGRRARAGSPPGIRKCLTCKRLSSAVGMPDSARAPSNTSRSARALSVRIAPAESGREALPAAHIPTPAATAGPQRSSNDEQLEPIFLARRRRELAAHRHLLVGARLAQRFVVVELPSRGLELCPDSHCRLPSQSRRFGKNPGTSRPRGADHTSAPAAGNETRCFMGSLVPLPCIEQAICHRSAVARGVGNSLNCSAIREMAAACGSVAERRVAIRSIIPEPIG